VVDVGTKLCDTEIENGLVRSVKSYSPM